MIHKCAWPGCSAESERPFTEGWSNYSDAPDVVPNLPPDGWLCPRHKIEFEALVVAPPTDSQH